MVKNVLFLLLAGLLTSNAGMAQSSAATDSIRNQALFNNIRLDDTAQTGLLLRQGASPNGLMNDYSALMAATLSGSTACMKQLIEHGANVNYFNKDSISAIWLAVPDMDKTSLLINSGAQVQQRSREDNTVLVKLASIPGSAPVFELLIHNGCNLQKSGTANDMMYNAAGSGDTALLGLLIRNGVSVNDTSSGGDYPVNSATSYRCFNSLKMLVDNGAAVNVSPKHAGLPLFNGVTPLMWAAVSNDKPSFYYLLDHGADAKAISPGGYTTLMFLAMSEQDEPAMAEALIKHGADPVVKALDETDALQHERIRGNTRSASLLTKYITTNSKK
ncbi:MAG: ankyrin repeat domain-containing protein [Bacteroidota bacterium]